MFTRPKTGGRTFRARSQVGFAMAWLPCLLVLPVLAFALVAHRSLTLFYEHRKPHDSIKITVSKWFSVEIRRDPPVGRKVDPPLLEPRRPAAPEKHDEPEQPPKQLERGINQVETKAIEAADPPVPYH